MNYSFNKQALLIVACLYTNLSFAQNVQLSNSELAIEPYLFGYNNSTWNSDLDWTSSDMKFTGSRLNMGNIRYPGGTYSNYWDWRTGTVMETVTSGWPKYVPDNQRFTPSEFVKAIPEGTEIVYCVNMARPTPATGISPYASVEVLKSQATLDLKIDDIIEGIDAFYQAGYQLKYVELGNEFYHKPEGGVDEQGAIYTGDVDLYINHANQLAQAIHNYNDEIQIAVIAERAPNNKELGPFTQSIYDAMSNAQLNHIDAVTFHWYSGPGVSELSNANQAMNSLAQCFHYAKNVKARDYNSRPEDLNFDIWVTEYNTWSDPNEPVNGGPIQDTWVNGMVGANLSLLYAAMGEDISLLNIHAIAEGGNTQWNMLEDDQNLSGNGVALSAVGRAMNGMDKMVELQFSDLPRETIGDGHPAVHGYKFTSDTKESIIIVNNADEAVNGLDITSLLTGTANSQMSQYYDTTPWNQGLTETNGISFNFSDRFGNSLDLPPFSITVIIKENQNLLLNASFEQQDISWTGGERIIARKFSKSGHSALLLETTSQGWASFSQDVEISPNAEYTLSAYLQTDLSQGNARLKASFYSSDGTEVGSRVFSSLQGASRGYSIISVGFITPPDASYAKIEGQIANGTGQAWFDDFVLRGIETQSSCEAPVALASRSHETVRGANDGTITFSFEDDPGRSNIEFSLDGGSSYPYNVSDNSGSTTVSDLAPDTYDIWVRWGNDDCPEDMGEITINRGPICTGYDIPDAVVTSSNESALNANDGRITFNFVDDAQSGGSRTNIEFSIDGGLTYPYNTRDSNGSLTVNGLAPNDYETYVRWGNDQCARELEVVTIKPFLQNAVLSVEAPLAVSPGSEVVVSVEYISEDESKLYVSFEDISDGYQNYGYVQQIVAAGSGSINFQLSIDENAPLTGVYQYQVVLTTVGGGWVQRKANQSLRGVTVSASAGRIAQLSSDEISVYPNPVRNLLHIAGLNGRVAKIRDLTGRVVLSSDDSLLDVSGLTSGVYLLEIQGKHLKFIKD